MKTCWEAIPPEKRVPEQIDRRLARRAVQAGLVTLWQAQQLLSGRSAGFKVDKYLLLELIGQGGMGRVYLALDTRLDRRVALKVLTAERVNNPRAIQRFHREIRVMAKLQHENLVRIYDEGEINGRCYFVMEYIEGKNLGTWVAEEGPIPPATVARLGRQVALGLEHAKQKGLIHRDVNPFNILVTRDGIAKLTDLGLAIDLADQDVVTRDGATVGTFDYISPEQARHSRSVDSRSDIYSLGCTLYHIISGRVPFPSPSLTEKLIAHQALEPEPLTSLVPGIPEGLAGVIGTMMRKSPDERYASPLEVAQALEPFIDDRGLAYRGDATWGSSGSFRSGSSGSDTKVTAGSPTKSLAAAVPDVSGPVSPRSPAAAAGLPPELAAIATGAASPMKEDPLGLGLDLGPEPTLSEVSVQTRVKSKAKPKPAPPTLPTPSSTEEGPDFGLIAKSAPPTKDVLGLALDLGSDPLLSPNVAKSQPPPQSKPTAPAASPLETPGVPPTRHPPGRRWILVVAAVLVLLVVAGAILAIEVLGPARPAPKVSDQSRSSVRPEPSRTDATRPEIPKAEPIAVRWPDGLTFEPDLKSAMSRAIGGKGQGQVLLNSNAPIRLSGADAAINISGGRGHRLIIAASEGVQPVLEIELDGKEPFLTTRSETPLTLTGVTIVARYVGHAKQAPPVIMAGDDLVLERCSFRATGAVPGARAVTVEGKKLDATGCWFEGFDHALEVHAYGGSTTTLRDCMFVRPKAGSASSGWALRVLSMPSATAKPGRKLVLERCTVQGQGLLDLVGFSPGSPYEAKVTGSAVLADALLAWEPEPPGAPLTPEALTWSGHGNLYDIRGPSWVVLSPRGSPALAGGPTDLASWSKRARESNLLAPPIHFRADPAMAAGSPRPYDIAILGDTVGADPDRVGPAATRP